MLAGGGKIKEVALCPLSLALINSPPICAAALVAAAQWKEKREKGARGKREKGKPTAAKRRGCYKRKKPHLRLLSFFVLRGSALYTVLFGVFYTRVYSSYFVLAISVNLLFDWA